MLQDKQGLGKNMSAFLTRISVFFGTIFAKYGANYTLYFSKSSPRRLVQHSIVRITLCLLFSIITFAHYIPTADAASLTETISNATTSATTNSENGSDVVDRPKDSYGRDTPRGTVQGFMQALASNDEIMAARYLNIPTNRNTTEVVRQFKQALDSGGRLSPDLQISNDAAGNQSDKLPTDIDKVGVINDKTGSVDILLEKVTSKDKDGQDIWLFSQKTLQKLPEINNQLKPSWVETYIPKTWLDRYIMGYSVGHIVATLALTVICFIAFYILSWLLFILYRFIYRLFYKRREMPIDQGVILPFATLGTAITVKELMITASISVIVRELANRGADIVGWVASAWLLLRITDVLFRRAEHLSINSRRPERLSVLSLLRKVVKMVFLIFAAIFILGNFGFDLTTGIAALGVGGLALALGAQKTVENLVGSVVLVADQPISVGDYCKFGTYEGFVEDIGIRSTRVRTPNRTIVTIPNGEFSAMQIENFSSRDMFHFLHIFYITRDTPTQALSQLISAMQNYISKHTDVTDFLSQVRIASMQQDAYNIEVRCYLIADNMIDFYSKQTRMIIEIVDIIERSGVKFALPTQQLVVQSQGNNDTDTEIFGENKEIEKKDNLKK